MSSINHEDSRIVVISNPRSGRNKRGGFEKFSKVINDYSQIKHCVTSSENELASVLQDCKKNGCEVIIVNGGDGTLLHILTFIKRNENAGFDPKLVLLKSGTTSMTYGDVGCKGSLRSILNDALKYCRGNVEIFTLTRRNVLRMTLPEQSLTVCGMFFGGGAIYNGILYCRQKIHTKGMRGEVGPSLAMIRYIFDWLTANKLTTSTYAHIQCDNDELVKSDFTIITATTLKRLLMGVFPFWGRPQSTSFIYITMIKRGAPYAARAFMKIIRGRNPNVETPEENYLSECASKVRLNINDGFTLDGELYGEPGRLTQVELESAGKVSFLKT